MKMIGTVAMAIGALTVFATAPAARAFAGPASQFQADDAEVVPTGQEVQQRLQQVAEELRAARLASVSATRAQSDYLAAQRAYEFGQYEDAMEDSSAAESAIPTNPNWFNQANLAAK